MNRFIDHLQVVTINNSNTIANFHTTNYSTLSSHCFLYSLLGNRFQQRLFLCNVFTRRFLVTDLNNGDSAVSALMSLLSGEYLATELLRYCLQGNSSARTMQKTQPLYCFRGVFAASLYSNGRGADHIENTVLLLSRACMLRALPSNGRCLLSDCLATGLYVTILSISWCLGRNLSLQRTYRTAWLWVSMPEFYSRCAHFQCLPQHRIY
jgi:hypothetical protein